VRMKSVDSPIPTGDSSMAATEVLPSHGAKRNTRPTSRRPQLLVFFFSQNENPSSTFPEISAISVDEIK
jgi:hypothetical protein